jgi:hypothetical protein
VINEEDTTEDAVKELKALLDEARAAIKDAITKLSSADAIVAHLTEQEKKDAGLSE